MFKSQCICAFIFLSFIFLVVLGFELRAPCLLGSCCTSWVTLPGHLSFLYEENFQHFFLLAFWNVHYIVCLFIYLLFWRLELRASHLLGRFSTSWATPPALFCIGFLEMGPCDLFVGADFPQSFWVARITGVSHQCQATLFLSIVTLLCDNTPGLLAPT
jgi:hypothetical protein